MLLPTTTYHGGLILEWHTTVQDKLLERSLQFESQVQIFYSQKILILHQIKIRKRRYGDI